MARYSASEELRETVDCFLDCQEIGDEPKYMTKQVVDFRESWHPAQSESLKARS